MPFVHNRCISGSFSVGNTRIPEAPIILVYKYYGTYAPPLQCYSRRYALYVLGVLFVDPGANSAKMAGYQFCA